MDLGLLHVMVLSITYGTAAQQQRNFMGCKNLSTGVPALLCAHQADKMVLWWCLHCLACKPGLQAWLASKGAPCTPTYNQCSCACRMSCPSGCWAPAAWSTWT